MEQPLKLDAMHQSPLHEAQLKSKNSKGNAEPHFLPENKSGKIACIVGSVRHILIGEINQQASIPFQLI